MSNPVAAPAAPAASAAPAPQNNAPVAEQPKLDAEISAEEAELEANLDETEEVPEEKEEKSSKKAKEEKKKEEKRLKKLKLKVDGKEIEEELDLDDDETLTRHLQMAKLGQKRAQEKAELEKNVENFLKALEADPWEAMKRMGKDPEKLIEDYINAQIEASKKSPEQLEKERMENELKALKAEREREKKELEERERTRLEEQYFQQFDLEMEQTLSKSDLPKTPYVVKKMADYMYVALEAGKNVKPEDVVDIVREELHSDLNELFTSLPEDKIEELLGEQVINKLRKRRIAKAKEANKNLPTKAPETGNNSKVEKQDKNEKKSFKDFFGPGV